MGSDFFHWLPLCEALLLRNAEPGERNLVLLREWDSRAGVTTDARHSAMQELKRALRDWERDEKTGVYRSSTPGSLFRPPGLTMVSVEAPK